MMRSYRRIIFGKEEEKKDRKSLSLIHLLGGRRRNCRNFSFYFFIFSLFPVYIHVDVFFQGDENIKKIYI